MSTQDKVRFEFSLITIMLSVEQLQSEERIIEGRTAVQKKRKNNYNYCLNNGVQSPILGSVSYIGLSFLYMCWSQL